MATSDIQTHACCCGSRIIFGLAPIRTFVTTSMLFGLLIIVVTPPLRGPDETAHFLRAYGIAAGDIIPSARDTHGRKGTLLPARLYESFNYFESIRVKEKGTEWRGYRPVFQAYFSSRSPTIEIGTAPTFVAYAGSEGYSPVAYLPQVAAASVAQALDLDFLPTLYMMRFAGLAVMTSLIAFAVSVVPQVAWAFIAVSMLPAALYGRAVINADGSALATAMVVSAFWLREKLQLPRTNINGGQPFWMMLTALTKPPNLALVLLAVTTPSSWSRGRWQQAILAVLPAIAIALLWSFFSETDTAAWRMVEITGQEMVAFDPSVKILYLLDHPLHFPVAVIQSLDGKTLGELWRQTIGVLGLFDTVLRGWVYPALTVLLVITFLTRLPAGCAIRREIAVAATITTLAYAVAVCLICYLVFTPHGEGSVWGIQGRYFIPALPLLAVVVAALVNRAPHEGFYAAAATSAAVLSGLACLDAILQTDWKVGL